MNTKSALRQARELRGWSQAKVAEAVDADIGTVSRWERGISTPSPYFREQLCHLFEMDAQALGFLQASETDQEEYTVFAQDQSSSILPITKDTAVIDPLIPNLASTNFVLIGHHNLLNNATLSLCKGGVYALFGLPGVGKTTLAIALTQHETIHVQFPDGILWAGLGPAPDIQSLLIHWGVQLGLSASVAHEQTTKNLSHVLQRTFVQRRFLLILDDVWTAEAAVPFLIGGPHCTHLVTTRFPRIAHMVTTSTSISVPVLNEEESFELLKTMVPDISQIDYTLTHSIIQQVGGLPLALTLIGKHLQIAAKSGQPRRLLSTLNRFTERSARLQLTFPAFPAEYPAAITKSGLHSLEDMIALSDQLLSSHAQAALRSLPLLPAQPNSFSESAALAVVNTTVEVLDELVDKGMIESHSPGHYTIHQLILDYCQHHHKATLDARKRLVDYGIRYAERCSKDFASLTLEFSVVLQALEEAYFLEQRKELVRGVCAIADFLCIQKFYDLAERHFARAYVAATEAGDLAHKVQILFSQGEIACFQENYSRAHTSYEEALDLAQQIQDREWQCKLLHHLGKIMKVYKNYTQALLYVQAALNVTNANNQHYYCRICGHYFSEGEP